VFAADLTILVAMTSIQAGLQHLVLLLCWRRNHQR
jgi:hypothetical protein